MSWGRKAPPKRSALLGAREQTSRYALTRPGNAAGSANIKTPASHEANRKISRSTQSRMAKTSGLSDFVRRENPTIWYLSPRNLLAHKLASAIYRFLQYFGVCRHRWRHAIALATALVGMIENAEVSGSMHPESHEGWLPPGRTPLRLRRWCRKCRGGVFYCFVCVGVTVASHPFLLPRSNPGGRRSSHPLRWPLSNPGGVLRPSQPCL